MHKILETIYVCVYVYMYAYILNYTIIITATKNLLKVKKKVPPMGSPPNFYLKKS